MEKGIRQPLSWAERGSVTALVLAGLLLIAFRSPWGLLIGLVGAVSLLSARTVFKRSIGLLYGAVGFLALAPINTDISLWHLLHIGVFLLPVIALPYVISRYVFGDHVVRFPIAMRSQSITRLALFVIATLIPAYFVLPFYLEDSGAYLNWAVIPHSASLLALFLGIMSLGVWDELFFSGVVLTTLKRFTPYAWANVAQAVLFASFLFALGFTGWWGPPLVFGFGLVRGEVFRRTKSLLPLLLIHAVVDVVLFFALVNVLYSELFQLFLP